MVIYLLRHGMTPWNYEYKIQGATDIPLHEVGIKMAEETAEAFRGEGVTFDKVYSSPLIRAVQSARIVSGREDIITDERLRELSFGVLEGLKVTEEKDKADSLFRHFKGAPEQYEEDIKAEPSIEPLSALCKRAADFCEDRIEEHPETDGTILISAHGALNQAILMHMRRDTDIANFWKGQLMPNCGIHIVHYDPAKKEYSMLCPSQRFYSDELYEIAPVLLK